jgi:hypothetical protein
MIFLQDAETSHYKNIQGRHFANGTVANNMIAGSSIHTNKRIQHN